MQSKITGGDTTLLFTTRVLNKYDVKYYRCMDTGFIQTEEPYWLADAYSSAITKLDVGMVFRNQHLAGSTAKLLVTNFDKNSRFLDYAGGYGLFTRLMRDKGFNFYHTDAYCQNIFAEYFDLSALAANSTFELITAFEVFEHLPDPITEIKRMLTYGNNLLFSTELQPDKIKSVNDWHYFATETGQHVAFYNETSLKAIAQQLGYNFYTDGRFLHLFTQRKFDHNPLTPPRDPFLLRKAKKYIAKAARNAGMPESLIMTDWQYIKDKLNGKG
jgi:hypothetical protein